MKLEAKQTYYKNYYQTIDGHYSSYWTGKLANTLIRAGHKQTVERHLQQTFSYLKLQSNVLPLATLLEGVERIKPTFNLSFVITSGKKQVFPVFLPRHKQLSLATRWLALSARSRKEHSLAQRSYSELLDLRESKRHTLIKQRDELFEQAVEQRFNTRYLR